MNSPAQNKSVLPRAYTLFERFLGLWDRLYNLFSRGQSHGRPRWSAKLAVEGMEDRLVPATQWSQMTGLTTVPPTE